MIRKHVALLKQTSTSQQPKNTGFGITEVMVASSLTLVVGATTMNIMMSQMLWQAKQVLRQDAVDQLDLARVQFRSSQDVTLRQMDHCELSYLEEASDGSWIHAESSCTKGKLNASVKGYLTRAEDLPGASSANGDEGAASTSGSGGSAGLSTIPLSGGTTSFDGGDSDSDDGDSDSRVGAADSDESDSDESDSDSDQSDSDAKSSTSCTWLEKYRGKC